MKTRRHYFQLHQKKTGVFYLVLCMFFFFGCKKSDDELNSSTIETKLTNTWKVPIILAGDACSTSALVDPLLYLKSGHIFKYTHGTCNINGTWSVSYNANRSGQDIKLTLNYTSTLSSIPKPVYDVFDLQYSSDANIFYALDTDTLGLKPFVKILP